VGDAVCVLFYCPTPYLLGKSGAEYVFVVEAYVHGLMYGEALTMFDEGKVKETSWIIKLCLVSYRLKIFWCGEPQVVASNDRGKSWSVLQL
jgi:hypothetical protein